MPYLRRCKRQIQACFLIAPILYRDFAQLTGLEWLNSFLTVRYPNVATLGFII
jgi:hypothetical protein